MALYAGISGRGAFTTTDGGQHWKAILTATTPAVATAIGPSPNGFSKVVIAIPPAASPPDPAGVQVLYVTLSGTHSAPDPVGLFLSTDQGASWTQRAAVGMPTRTQNGYSFHMAIDPASPGDGVGDIIYFGTVGQGKSTDAGATFTKLNGLHADTHAWAFVAQPSPALSMVYVGCDGGVDRSDDGGATWISLNAGGLQTALFYNIDVRPDATASVTVGAAQDNGVQTTKGATTPGWREAQGGDGWDVAYDGAIAGHVYCSSGYWSPAPCTRVYRSTDDGQSFPVDITPWTTTTDKGCYLAPVTTDPTTGGIVYVSGSQHLWQSLNGGGMWRMIGTFARTGNVDVAHTNGNHLVIAVGKKVFVSTNALAAAGVAFTDITRNLPGRTVPRAAFDPVDPTMIYAVVGGFAGTGPPGHVFRTTIGASAWTDISPQVGSPAEPIDVPFTAIALDGSDIPTTIYVGTDLGVLRSRDGGGSWSVLDDVHFPRAPVADLVLNQKAGALTAATYGRGVFKFVKPAGPAIAFNLQDDLAFGTVCSGPRYLTLQIYNVGAADLVIGDVQRIFGSMDFTVLPTPATPLVIGPGEEVDFTIRYSPGAAGVAETAIIRVASNDPAAPFVDLAATGGKGTGQVATAIAHDGFFGEVCVGALRDEPLTINNPGACPLAIERIISSSVDFRVPDVLSYPLVVGPGASITVTIRFQPASTTAGSGTITILSDDPDGPHNVAVSGVTTVPRLALAIADSGDFGPCCVGSFVDEDLVLSNSGKCRVTVGAIASSSAEFLLPEVLSYAVVIAPGVVLAIPIRFAPTSLGAKSATITVDSDDPAGPRTIEVAGFAPAGKLAVTGSTVFGGVKCCQREQRRVSVCNVGDCALHVASVALKRPRRHVRLINNPFPATLHPGSCLDVVIQYRATERVPKACELIITTDDPDDPVRCLDVIAWTNWDCCNECSCEGRKECCGDRRQSCCRRQGKNGDCGDEDDGDGEED